MDVWPVYTSVERDGTESPSAAFCLDGSATRETIIWSGLPVPTTTYHTRGALILPSAGGLAAPVVALMLVFALPSFPQRLLVPMDDEQTDHLRAYGLTHWCLDAPREFTCEWLLNCRAGSFVVPDRPEVRARAAQPASTCNDIVCGI